MYVYFFLGRVQSRIKKDTLKIPIFSTIIYAKNEVNVLKTFVGSIIAQAGTEYALMTCK